MPITLDTTIEDLVTDFPEAVSFLMDKGIRCLACGEPIWGTLGQAMHDKGFSPVKQQELLADLKEFLAIRQKTKA